MARQRIDGCRFLDCGETSHLRVARNIIDVGHKPQTPVDCFRRRNRKDRINRLNIWLVCGSSKQQQQIPLRILDDEILGAPRLLFQRLLKDNASGLKLKEQQLDLIAVPTVIKADNSSFRPRKVDSISGTSTGLRLRRAASRPTCA